MARLSADALAYHKENTDLLKARFQLILSSDHQYDSGIFNNLAGIAIMLKDFDFAKSVAESCLVDGKLVVAFNIQNWLRNSDVEVMEIANAILADAADAGHLLSRRQQHVLKLQRYGFLGILVSIPNALYLALFALIISSKNINDPRVAIPPK